MSSVPDGRAANHPWAVTTLTPPIATLLPGARVTEARMGLPASSLAVIISGESLARAAFCSGVAGESMRS